MKWEMRPLEDVATLQRGYDLPVQNRKIGDIPIYAANGIVGYHSEKQAVGPGVITGRSGSIGNVQFSEGPYWPLNTSLYVRDFHGNVPRYVYWLLRHLRLERFHEGTGVPTLNRNIVHRVSVPVPPIPQQRRIAEILDKADALRAKRRAAIDQLDTLTQSIFLEMFGDPVANPKGWPVERLGQLVETTSGGTPRRDVGEYFGGHIPWVKSGELHGGVVTTTEEKLTDRGLAESSAKIMPIGTVLVAMYGATVGAVAVLGIEAATNQAVCCIRPSDQILADFLVFLLRWSTPALLAKRVGGAQPNLSQDLLRNLIVPAPPRQLQEVFAGRVARAAETKRAAFRSSDEINSLFGSLQHHAFRGDL